MIGYFGDWVVFKYASRNRINATTVSDNVHYCPEKKVFSRCVNVFGYNVLLHKADSAVL